MEKCALDQLFNMSWADILLKSSDLETCTNRAKQVFSSGKGVQEDVALTRTARHLDTRKSSKAVVSSSSSGSSSSGTVCSDDDNSVCSSDVAELHLGTAPVPFSLTPDVVLEAKRCLRENCAEFQWLVEGNVIHIVGGTQLLCACPVKIQLRQAKQRDLTLALDTMASWCTLCVSALPQPAQVAISMLDRRLRRISD